MTMTTTGLHCFSVWPTGTVYRYLRRYRPGEDFTCDKGFHEARRFFDEVAAQYNDDGQLQNRYDPASLLDGEWPTTCDRGCGYVFAQEPGPEQSVPAGGDVWQVFIRQVYADDLGRRFDLDHLRPGAVYDAWWDPRKGPDGKSLVVVLPDGHRWHVDGRSSNCDRPDDDVHRCWVRHGEPPDIDVDKNGNTCTAGAGSIAMGEWHGFLRRGYLVEC